jgi:hypothetical protein
MYQPLDRSGAGAATHDSPGVFISYVQPAEEDHVGVFELHPDGTRNELPSQLVDLDAELLARIGIDGPKAVLIAPLDQATVMAGNRGEIEVEAIAFDADDHEVGHEDVNFWPSSCPDRPVEPPPLPPAGRTPVPVKPDDMPKPSEMDQPFTDVCPTPMASTPPKMTAFELNDRPLGSNVATPAAEQGLRLAPANYGDYVLVHTPGADLTDVDRAVQVVSTQERHQLDGAGFIDDPTIYLGRFGEDQRLVWVVDDTIKAVQTDPGGRAEPIAEPRRFIGAVDAKSGDLIKVVEVP